MYVSTKRIRRIEKRRKEAEIDKAHAEHDKGKGRYAGHGSKRAKEKSRVTLPKRPNPERSDHRGAWDGD